MKCREWTKAEEAIQACHEMNQMGADMAVIKQGTVYVIRPMRIAIARKYCVVWPSQTPMTREAIADEQYLRGRRARGYNGRR